MTPPQCPTTEAGTGKPYFQKEFFHNGYIKSLKQLVHFYNTRDTSFAYPVTSGHCPAGTIERVTCWPMKEVPNNLDTTTGMLGLTDTEENQIVAFLETLTDGFTRPYPTAIPYGQLHDCDPATDPNCSPSRQGNGELIPTPPLPPCASAVCGVAPVPNPPDSVAQTLNGESSKPMTSLLWLVRLAKPRMPSGRAGARDPDGG